MEKEKVLAVKDLRINFSTDNGYVQAVRGVSFDLYKGETLCIVGESGSGKSVTNKAIMGILSANGRIVDGSIMYEGEDLTKVSEDEFHRIRGNKIGMIFQDPLSSLNPIMKIGKQITETMLINSSRTKKIYDDVVAKELAAYRNAQTALGNLRKNEEEEIAFLNEERKKEIALAKHNIEEKINANLYSISETYKANKANILEEKVKNIDEIKAKLASKEITFSKFNKEKSIINKAANDMINSLNKKFILDKAEASKNSKELRSGIKTQISEISSKFDEEIVKVQKQRKADRKKFTKKYKKLIKKTRKAYQAKKGVAKKEVKKYLAMQRKNYIKDVANVLYQNRGKSNEKIIQEIKKAKDRYISTIKITKEEAKAKALKIMEEVGISEPEKRFEQYPFEFSGGMRQRIVIAIALTADPDILICDEPTTALDVTIQAQILELINRLKKERNLSCIFITHDLGVVANMADRVAVMYAGKIVEYGKEEEIFYDPKHPYTWALLSSIPDVDSNEKLEAIPGTPPNMIYPPKGDAFALRSKYAMEIDFKEEPPFFKVSNTHYAATWLLDPRAPKVEMPKIVKTRIENSLKKQKLGAK